MAADDLFGELLNQAKPLLLTRHRWERRGW